MDKSKEITLIATLTFGLEAVVKRELIKLGFRKIKSSNGKVEFSASVYDIPKANLWLRSADRVWLKFGQFEALTFDDLFEQTKALPWEDWIGVDGKFTVIGKSVKSTLGSVRACQSIVKKAVVERMKAAYKTDWFEESGAEYTIQIAMLNDVATLAIDTSGSGLNKRGYRTQTGTAAIKETLAAAMVQLSFWNKDRLLIDPMCGSGTILIEAALIARNIAPGLQRRFASDDWPVIGKNVWRNARREARDAVATDGELQLYGYDIDELSISAAKVNAQNAGVGDDIFFVNKNIQDLWIDQQYGIIISNPPYGIKMTDFQDLNQIYISLHKTFKGKPGWSVYILTADKEFPNYFKRAKPDKVRKLFNGSIEVNYYQYFGERPK